jgi:hypothetical protein
MPNDPVTRLQFCRDEIDRCFGFRIAAAHPEVIVATMQAATWDHAALVLARAITSFGGALLVDADAMPADSAISRRGCTPGVPRGFFSGTGGRWKGLILLVGAPGFEPGTPSPPDWCANRAALRSA